MAAVLCVAISTSRVYFSFIKSSVAQLSICIYKQFEMKRARSIWKAFKMAGAGFFEDNAFKLSASLSYYTVFALGPLIIMIISLAGLFFGQEAVQGRVYMQLNGL